MHTKALMTGMFATLVALHTAVAYAAPAKPVDTKHSVSGNGTDGLIKVATCNDGKSYYAPTNEHRGACSGHQGVAEWADGSPVRSNGRKTQYK